MPLSKEQVDNWFTFHPPTDEQKVLFGAVVTVAKVTRAAVEQAFELGSNPVLAYTKINDACRTLVEVIDANAPDSADKTAAIRCVRIARMAANAAVQDFNTIGCGLHARRAIDNLYAAQWQACAAIACGGK